MKFGPVQDPLLSWVSRKVRLNSDWAFYFPSSVLNQDCNEAFSWGQYWLSWRKKAAVGSLATPNLQSFLGFSSFKSFPTDFLSIWLWVTIFMYSNCTSQKWKKMILWRNDVDFYFCCVHILKVARPHPACDHQGGNNIHVVYFPISL